MYHISFSESTLRYFLLNYGQRVLQEYLSDATDDEGGCQYRLDEEDLYILDALVDWELSLLSHELKSRKSRRRDPTNEENQIEEETE